MLNSRRTAEGLDMPYKKEDISEDDIFNENIILSKDLKSPFRLTSKNLVLIYPNITISHEEVLNQLRVIFKNNIQQYLICQLESQDFQNQSDEKDSIFVGKKKKVVYVYIYLKKQINITAPTRLNLVDSQTFQSIDGIYKSVKNKSQIINSLIKKDPNNLSNFVYNSYPDNSLVNSVNQKTTHSLSNFNKDDFFYLDLKKKEKIFQLADEYIMKILIPRLNIIK